MAIAYVYLAICIVANLLSCALLTASDGFTKPLQSASGIALVLLNYFFLSKAILYIDISISYAIWAAIGIIVTTLISVFYFKQHLTKTGILFIGIIMIGLVIIHLFGTI